jgi:tetratricopeptide (TPR) repeat protein
MTRRLVSLLLLICAAITNRAQDSQEPLIDHFSAGQRAAAEHQIDRAITEFRAVLRLDPTVVQARANLGLMYYLAGRYKDAVSELSKVTRAAPDVLAGHLFLGMSYVKLAQLSRSRQIPTSAATARVLRARYN